MVLQHEVEYDTTLMLCICCFTVYIKKTSLLNNFCFLATAKPGRVVGPVLLYEYERIAKSSNDPRMVYPNTTQSVSTHNVFSTHPSNPKTTSNTHKDFSQDKNEFQSQQYNLQAAPTTDSNNYPYRRRGNNNNLNDHVTSMDAKLLQTQSHLDVVGAAAVAVATQSHRYSRGIQYSLS